MEDPQDIVVAKPTTQTTENCHAEPLTEHFGTVGYY